MSVLFPISQRFLSNIYLGKYFVISYSIWFKVLWTNTTLSYKFIKHVVMFLLSLLDKVVLSKNYTEMETVVNFIKSVYILRLVFELAKSL